MHFRDKILHPLRLVIVAGIFSVSPAFVAGIFSVSPALASSSSKILFSDGTSTMFTINPDGTDKTAIGSGFDPHLSPDGTKIVYFNFNYSSSLSCGDEIERDVYTMNYDGTGITNLTAGARCTSSNPAWSPDGAKIAFDDGGNVYVMNADGSNVTLLQSSGNDPTWSPDGTKIAYVDVRAENGGISVINADGSNPTRLAATGYAPSWSPDGTKIAFQDVSDTSLKIMNPNGSGQTTLFTASAGGGLSHYASPGWSPDSSNLAFTYYTPSTESTYGIYTIPVSSGSPTQIYTGSANLGQGVSYLSWGTIQTIPPAPTNLAAPSPTNSAPLLSWDAVTGATSYNIYRNGSLIDSINSSANPVMYTDYLAPSGTNSYYVTAVNSAGESGHSNTISVTYVAINSGGSTQGTYVADTDVSGGSTYSSSSSVDTSGVTNPASQAVYQTCRYGNFTYTIPNLTANTSYTVRLHFNELYWNSVGSRVFNASINGNQVLHNFDIFKTAGGENKALVEQFNATSDSNGNIAIAFSTVTDNAMVNGIELDSSTVPTHALSGTVYNDTNRNGTQDAGESGYNGATVTLSDGQTKTTDSNGNYTFSNLPQEDAYTATVSLPNDYVATTANPVRFALNADTTKDFGLAPFQSLSINAGGSSASSFVSDEDYSGGTPYSSSASVNTSGVTNPAPQSVYQTVRYGNTFSYTIPNLSTSHTYTVRLHFNELYWNSAGSRVFNVSMNGTQVLNNYDIFQDAGGENIAVVKQFTETPDTNGNITITFTTVTDNAMVNGIEIEQQ